MATVNKATIAAFVDAALGQFAAQKLSNHVDELKTRLRARFPDVNFGGVIIDYNVQPTYWYVVAGHTGGLGDLISPKDLVA